ncbi:HpcH/HpaI aldolase/citrate lyase family protein [Nocardia crassostreae]|uniref:HpcH/HpaI aldolase/citrate lyase family protein n=1 Tax=Nocardia crassostreae TaxID=53428 RepID=UPI001C3FD7F9|nr:CoA ester lyase [Nocardia crassostreae]
MAQRVPPRSWLSVLASRPDLVGKAARSGADGIIVDLEDAVAPAEKDVARAGLSEALAVARTGIASTLVVRVNAPGTPWCHLDLVACAATDGPDAVMLPKTESPGDIAFADRLLAGAQQRSGIDRPVGVYALLESAAGIAAAGPIARASARVCGLAIGYADLAASLGRSIPDRWLYAQDAVLTAARAAGLEAVDGPYLGVAVDDEFRASCATAAGLGFDGKWVIHPRQVAAVNDAFTPSPEETARAEAVVSALAAHHRLGVGAFTLDGVMIDDAVALRTRRVLVRAGRRLPDHQEQQ